MYRIAAVLRRWGAGRGLGAVVAHPKGRGKAQVSVLYSGSVTLEHARVPADWIRVCRWHYGMCGQSEAGSNVDIPKQKTKIIIETLSRRGRVGNACLHKGIPTVHIPFTASV